tara:strand:- start:1963 stop:2760 length:798 start_codon:yes stop_codon:yes gene_type:complete
MTMIIKTSAMTPGKARALEALAGLAVGGAAGGLLGGKTFQTKKPRYWVAGNQVYGRDLTKAEKKDYVKRLAKAALLGGTGVAGLSLGVSAIRRRILDSQDIAAGRKAFKRIFRPLDIAIRRQQGTVKSRSGVVDHLMSRETAVRGPGRSAEQLHVASDLQKALAARDEAVQVLDALRSQRKKHKPKKYRAIAAKHRAHVPWGGKTLREEQVGGKVYQIPSRLTAEGQMVRTIGPSNVRYEAGKSGKVVARGPGQNYWFGLARGGS